MLDLASRVDCRVFLADTLLWLSVVPSTISTGTWTEYVHSSFPYELMDKPSQNPLKKAFLRKIFYFFASDCQHIMKDYRCSAEIQIYI